jgi:phosphonate transport system substrate-binding protein
MKIRLGIARFLQFVHTGLLLAGLGAGTVLAHPAAELRFSVAPYLSPARMEELYTPMAAHFSKELGLPVSFRTSSTFDRYFEQLTLGSVDFTLLHAFFYVEAVDRLGYVPLARMKEPFKGLLVVLDQSPVRNLSDLKGKTIATPPEFLPTVHLVRRIMRDNRLRPDEDFVLRSFRSVESCLQQLVIGEAQACICPPFAIPGAQARFNVKFRTVVESPGIPNLTFVAHPRVPAAQRRQIQSAILGWSSTEAGRQLVANIGTAGFVEVQDGEFSDVRRLMRSLDQPWLPTTR